MLEVAASLSDVDNAANGRRASRPRQGRLKVDEEIAKSPRVKKQKLLDNNVRPVFANHRQLHL